MITVGGQQWNLEMPVSQLIGIMEWIRPSPWKDLINGNGDQWKNEMEWTWNDQHIDKSINGMDTIKDTQHTQVIY